MKPPGRPAGHGSATVRNSTAALPDAGTVALAEDLRQAVGAFVRRVRTATDTPREVGSETLGDLDRQGPMTVAALARLRQVRHQSMRVAVAKLEAAGMVARAPDAADARSQIVGITGAGRTALASARAARARWMAVSLQAHATVQEREALATAIAVLRRLAATPG